MVEEGTLYMWKVLNVTMLQNALPPLSKTTNDMIKAMQ